MAVKEIEDLIIQNKIKNALEKLLSASQALCFYDLSDQIILQLRSYNNIYKKETDGTHSSEFLAIQEAKIAQSTLRLTRELNAKSDNSDLKTQFSTTQIQDDEKEMPNNSTVELYFQGDISCFTDSKKEILKKAIASILEIEIEQVNLKKVVPGSIRICIELPKYKSIDLLNKFNDEEVDFNPIEKAINSKLIAMYQLGNMSGEEDEYWQRRGEVSYKLKNYVEALRCFEEANRLKPNFYNYLIGIGKSYHNLNKFDKAKTYFFRALKLSPFLPEAWIRLGDTYFKQSNYDLAIEVFSKACEINPSNSYPFDALGRCYYSIKKDKDALNYFKKSIEINPDSPLSYYGIGNIYLDNKKYDDAKDFFLKSVSINQSFLFGWYGLGNTNLMLKKYDEAEEALLKSIKNDSLILGLAHISLAELYQTEKKYTEALTHYEKALRIDPNSRFAEIGQIQVKNIIENHGHEHGVKVTVIREEKALTKQRR